MEPFEEATRANNTSEVIALLRSGVPASSLTSTGLPWISLAAIHDRADMVRTLCLSSRSPGPVRSGGPSLRLAVPSRPSRRARIARPARTSSRSATGPPPDRSRQGWICRSPADPVLNTRTSPATENLRSRSATTSGRTAQPPRLGVEVGCLVGDTIDEPDAWHGVADEEIVPVVDRVVAVRRRQILVADVADDRPVLVTDQRAAGGPVIQLRGNRRDRPGKRSREPTCRADRVGHPNGQLNEVVAADERRRGLVDQLDVDARRHHDAGVGAPAAVDDEDLRSVG